MLFAYAMQCTYVVRWGTALYNNSICGRASVNVGPSLALAL